MEATVSNRQRKTRLNSTLIKKDTLRLLLLTGIDAEVGVTLVGDRRMKSLNKQYRGKGKTTDVLSFPLFEPGEPIEGENRLLGDIVINPAQALRQAGEYGVTTEAELRRLLVHGFLHLIGYDHEASKEEALRMKRKENSLIEKLSKK